MQILEFPEAEVPSELRAQVWALQEQAWPSCGSDPGLSHDPALRPYSMLLVDGGRVLAALDVLGKELVHAGATYRARGLSTVVTDRAYQGRGHGRQLVAAARRRIEAGGADLGLFTCDRPLQGFYESAGWQPLPGTVLIGGTAEDPFPSDRPGFDKVAMAAFCSDRARAARESFRHTRIALYPGSIDRLW
ncbi:GNAT family N-acetyltransferase [Kitasatospora atroaurantiaca]|uniref:Acetyltransferase (GNAT) family protein n=1 Tax=Kitasatospora atroaurantiaca TaxID=285545 RepID=A0A561ER94_9ACTN|nr:GNAT family N-acetyltransferase [Kitasatospora atroaurantiaca]TWE18136.1 acetyltransferase (GNAT) family protein [Kitasatospora atroaurantiaca]